MASSSDRVSRLLGAMETTETQTQTQTQTEVGPGAGSTPGVLTLPRALRRARVRVASPVLAGAVLVVLAVLAVLGVRVLAAQPSSEATAIPRADSVAVTATQAPSPGAGMHADAAPAAASTASGTAYVHVIGAVRDAGVVDVPAGSRVADAVDAAGGLSAKADPARLNLARLVADGERIWVPVKGAEAPAEAVAPSRPAAGSVAPSASSRAAAGPIDLNAADSTTLQTLSGVGPVTAEAILAWRAEHGRFSSTEELLEVSGIGPKTVERLRSQVTVNP
ncbi:MAG TPA: helix-hairpin-helix domain-containing protein [Ornithinimicrobium sp.]|uniref:helix-hairpin-helix domain-containing protein n=1 Tax=Ornithinimicrobium sp. TaxID=1977084 RepID=UPI002B45E2D6|nr:helix-hairpin-helix domain-containing protein [Ornithinimicrobium sp.]HKJ12562.1 helix-hairpin-helix domain-containing protein [Ornithinimicrobium sp.]